MFAKISERIIFRRDGYKLRFYPSSLSAALWIDHSERLDEESYIKSLIKKGDTVVDVGANIGTISLAMAEIVGSNGKIFSIEPNPEIFNYLTQNIELNGLENIIEARCIALGQNNEEMFLSQFSDDTQNRISNEGDLRIPVKRLDEVFPNINIDFLKIDVEGYEYNVLKGGESLCKRCKAVYLECIPEMLEVNSSNEEQLVNLLEEYGFLVYCVTDAGLIKNKLGSSRKKMLLGLRD